MITDSSARTSARRIARNVALRSVGDIVAKLASLVFFVTVARKLGATGFGNFSFALALTGALILASGFGTDTLLTREVARDYDRLPGYLANVVAVKALTSVGALGVAFAVANIGDYSHDTRAAVYLIGAAVAIENLGRTWQAAFQAYERLEFISLSLVVQRVVTAAAAVVVLQLHHGLVAVSLVYLLGSVIGLAVASWSLRRFIVVPRWEFQAARFLPILKAGVPIGLVGLLFSILLRTEPVLLSFLKHAQNTEVGIYSAAFRILEATMFLSWAFGAAMLPWLARSSAAKDARLVRGYEVGLKAIVSILMPVGVALVLLAQPIVDVLYGDKYDASVLPLRILGALTVLYGVNYFTGVTLTAHDRPGLFSRLFAVVIVVDLACNAVLIPPYGAAGAAVSAAVAGALLAVLSLRQVRAAIGPVRIVRTFAGSLAGGAAMAAVVLTSGASLVPALVLGGAVYLAAQIAFERLAYREDLSLLLQLTRRAEGPS